MDRKQRVLVAGATGYLGKFVVKEMKKQGYWVRALSRDDKKIESIREYVDEIFIGEVTQRQTLKGMCKDIDIVFSSIGITRQRDGLTYMDVDYQGNRNILDEALVENVNKFVYVSVLNADKLRHLEIVRAKEKFTDELKEADIDYVIVRPNGFFSDVTEFFNMAKRGRVYLSGKGDYRANPIDGADLARACMEHLDSSREEFDIGGPEILTQNEIAAQAFEILGKNEKITRIPLFVKNVLLKSARLVTSARTYGPLEFFLTVLTMDMVAPMYGRHTIGQYFRILNQQKVS